LRIKSTSPVTVDEEGFARTAAVVECASARERRRLECLLDEYDPDVDVFSLRDRLPNLVEIGVQFESALRDDALWLLRRRLRRLTDNSSEPGPENV